MELTTAGRQRDRPDRRRRRRRVRHIVKLSAMGPATRLNPLAWHMEIEAHLSRLPVASTALRPSAFADILISGREVKSSAGSWTGAAADGRVNFIDTRDIAEAARVACSRTFGPNRNAPTI